MTNTSTGPERLIFPKSSDEGILTKDWRIANVTLIHKKGGKKLTQNYRPGSLTLVAGKIMESVVRDAVVKHVTTHDLFEDSQHGLPADHVCLNYFVSLKN